MNTDICCGCELCMHICSAQAISMAKDREGFLYPVINKDLCKNCGLCEHLCIYKKHKRSEDFIKPKTYCAKNKDTQVQLKSSSGGVFPEIARYVLDLGGVVYGAAYDVNNDLKVYHHRICNVKDINMLVGSKYVQSTLQKSFLQIKTDLEKNRTVLFTGTPCQVNAIKEFVKFSKLDDSNLYTCDFICHGVSSPLVWNDYIQEIKRIYGRIIDYSFRYKSDKCKWGDINVSILTESNGQNVRYTNTRIICSFINLYFGNLITRLSCASCPYTSLQRVSDISLADCWGIETVDPSMYDTKGVSLVIVNNEKGNELFESIMDGMTCKRVDIGKLNQPHLYSSCIPSPKREEFWNRYIKDGYKAVAKRYTDYGFIRYIRKNIFVIYGKLAKVGKRIIQKN